MGKLYSIDFVSIGVLIAIICGFVYLSISSFDRHMYRGVDVIKQDGNVLFVTIDDRLKLGTDAICLEATKILAAVARQSNCYIQVVPDNDEWVPFKDMVMSYTDLVNIIESGRPY